MKDFQNVIGKYLLNREKNKKYLAVLLALCLLVSFAVPYSLIQPADSLTIDRSHLATQLSGAPSRPANKDGWFDKVQTQIPDNAFNFADKITATTVTAKDGNSVQDDGNGNITIQGGGAAGVNVNFALTYTADSNTVSLEHPCIYYQLPEGVTVPNEYYGSAMGVVDPDYKNGEVYSGYYTISKDGLIVIQFTDDYINYLSTTNSYTGTINFDGYIAAAETASGDRTVTIGNATITVEFTDATYNIYKQATNVQNNGNGTATVTWQIRANSYGGNWQLGSLAGVTVTDARFPSGGTGVTVSPSGYGRWDGTSYVFNNNYGGFGQQGVPGEVTFTFSETVTEDQLNEIYSDTKKLSNTASITYTEYTQDSFWPTQKTDSVTADATFQDTTVTKSGNPDYMTGAMQDKVNWTITLDNPYGANLSSYTVTDQMLSSAVDGSIVVKDANGNDVGYTISGSTITLGTTDASKVVIKYATAAELGKTYNNTVSVAYPGEKNKLPDYPASVEYSNPYTLDKNASGFDPESKKAFWEVTVSTKANTMTLGNHTFTDDAFANLNMSDLEVLYVRSGSNADLTGTATDSSISFGDYGILTKNGSTISIADGSLGGLNEIKLRYSTTVSDTEIANQSTVSNDIEDSSGNTDKAYNELKTPYTLNKSGSYDASTQKVTWTITVKNGASNTATLDGMVLTDPAFENLFTKNFKLVHAYQPSYTDIGGSQSGDVVTFGNGSTMTLSKVNEEYVLTFANVNGEGVNEVQFTYETDVSDADIENEVNQSNEVTANKPTTGNGKVEVQVNNPYQLDKNGSFDASTGEVTWTVTVKSTAGNNASLGGVILKDDAFANIDATKIKITTSNYNYTNAPYTVSGNTITFTNGGTATFNDNTLTFSEGAKVGELVFQYTTKVSDADFKNQVAQTNKIEDNFGHVKEPSVAVTNPYGLTKRGQFNAATGTITWTVEVSGVKDENTPFALLGGMELYDEMLKASEGKLVDGIDVTYAGYQHNYYYAEGLTIVENSNTSYTITKNDKTVATITLDTATGKVYIANTTDSSAEFKGIHKLTFTYETKVDAADIVGQVTQYNTIYDNKGHNVPAQATPTNPYQLSKTGQYDGEHKGVFWTIQTKNEGKGTIAGVELTDSKFEGLTIEDFEVLSAGLDGNYTFTAALNAEKTAIDITINGAAAGSLSLSADGKLVVSDDANLDDLRVRYYKALTDEEKSAGHASNYVTDNKDQSASDSITVSSPYTLEKGGSYNADEGKITWNINAGINSVISTASLDKTVLTDIMLKRLTSVDEINVTTASYNGTTLTVMSRDTENNIITLGANNTEYATMTFDFTAGTVTFADKTEDGTTGVSRVNLEYKTTPTADERAAGKASNNVSGQGKSDGAEVPIETRSSLNKVFDTATKSETIYGNDGEARNLDWYLELIEDGGFAAKGFLVDTLTQSVAGTHYITKTQADAIEINAGVKQADNYNVPLTAGTDYTITFYDAENKAITEWTDTTTAAKFEIDFNESVDTQNLRYMKVAYQTTADITKITVDENAVDKVTANFGNNVTFGNNSDTDNGFYFERYPADYVEKVSITVEKHWQDNSGDSQSGIQVQLYRKLNNGTSDWEPYLEPITLTNAENWKHTWENLPKTEETRTTEYLYKVEEFEVANYNTSYSNNGGINSGTIGITNTPLPKVDKVYVSSTGEIKGGSEVLLENLEKVNIDNVDYYIMQWKIKPDPKGTKITDTLPTGWTLLEDANDQVKKYGPFVGDDWNEYAIVGWQNTSTYTNNDTTVTFDFCNSNYTYMRYFLKIPVDTLKQQMEDNGGSIPVTNTVKAEGGNDNPVTITVNETASSGGEGKDLLTKEGAATLVPGRLKYTILVNPDGKNLSNGDTIDIHDAFDLLGYSGLSAEQVAALNASLSDIRVEEVSVADDMSYAVLRELSSSEYQYTLDYKLSEVITKNYNFTANTTDIKDNPPKQEFIATGVTPGEQLTVIVSSEKIKTQDFSNIYLQYEQPYYDPSIDATSKVRNAEAGTITYTYSIPEGATTLYIRSWDDVSITSVTATSTRTETTTADLNISVPDERPLLVTYYYDITGVDLKNNDIIKADNTASFDTGNASASDTADKDEFVVVSTGATVTANKSPVINKTSTNDYSLTLNDATFKLAYYTAANGWVFATGATEATSGNNTTYTPVWDADANDNTTTGKYIPTNAHAFNIGTISMKLEEGRLYKIIETDVPEAYEGSNLLEDFDKLLTKYKSEEGLADTYQALYGDYMAKFVEAYPNTTNATFEQLLQLHLKGVTGGPYDNFFNNFQSTFYFTYGSSTYTAPSEFNETVMTVPLSGTLSLTNSMLMDVKASKEWDATVSAADKANATVTLKLYWSTVRKSNGFPDSLNLATATDLGLVSEFTNEQTIGAGQTANWGDLPAGINGRPIYYYVKETAYTIGGVTYTLDEATGHYVAASGAQGAYKPIYVGNGSSGSDANVTVTNTKGLSIGKVWKNSDNSLMTEDQIPLDEVPVNLYGKTSTGAETLIGTFTLTKAGGWVLTVDDTQYNLTPYTSFRVEEALASNQLYGYAISYTYNTNGPSGYIEVSNKDNAPTEVTVAVTKEWADTADHSQQTITVNLWRTTEYQSDNGISLNESNAELVGTVTLSAANSWTYEWKKQNYKSTSNQRYYYYPVEVVPDGYAANYNRIETAAKQEATITNYVPGTLSLEKTWQNSEGAAISGNSALLPESIELEIYRRLNVAVSSGTSTTKPTSMNIVALGDSITQGTSGSGGPYTTKLDTLLESGTYGFTNVTIKNGGQDGNAIMSMPDGTYYTSGEGRQGLLNRLDGLSSDLSNADVVLILIGTNDMISNYTNYTKERLTALLDAVYGKVDSDTTVFIASIPDFDFVDSNGNAITVNTWFGSDKGFDRNGEYADLQTFEDYVNDTMVVNYNNVIKDLVENPKSTWTHLNFVDVNSAVDKDTQLDDGCHPNGTGYQNIANTFGAAINAYYSGGEAVAPPTDIDSVPEDLTSDELVGTYTITPDDAGNWKLNLKLEDKAADGTEYIYYAKEKNTGTDYNPTYQNNGQILGDTSETIKIGNTIDVAKTEIYVNKVWLDGNSAGRPADISLSLQRSADGGTTWEPVNASINWNKSVTPWVGTYSNLEMADSNGNFFTYKVTETVPDGYKVSYSDPDGILLSENASADDRTMTITNSAVFNLKVSKLWANGADLNSGKTVTIKIHRALADKLTGSGLMLALSTNTLKVQTGSDGMVTANNTGITAESNDTSVATVTVDGKNITIHGVKEGTATITVKSGSETETITVTVSDAPVLELTGTNPAMTAGQTQQLTAKMSDDSTIPGTVTYSSGNSNIATVDANGVVTAVNQGEVTITATNGAGLTATYTINVSLSDTLALNADKTTIYINGTAKVTPAPIYGTFGYESLNPEIASVNNNGEVTGLSAGTATIQVTRNDGKKATVDIVVEEVPLTVSPTSVTVKVDETATLRTNKTLTADMVTASANVEIVSVEGDTITIKGVTAGSATVTVNDGVTIPQTVNVTVQTAAITGTIQDADDRSKTYTYVYDPVLGTITFEINVGGNKNVQLEEIGEDSVLKDLIPIKYQVEVSKADQTNIWGRGPHIDQNWKQFSFSGTTGTIDVSGNTKTFAQHLSSNPNDLGFWQDPDTPIKYTIFVKTDSGGSETTTLTQTTDVALENSANLTIPDEYLTKSVSQVQFYFRDSLTSFPDPNTTNWWLNTSSWGEVGELSDHIYEGQMAARVYSGDTTNAKYVGYTTSQADEIEKVVVTYTDGSTFTVNNTAYVGEGTEEGGESGGSGGTSVGTLTVSQVSSAKVEDKNITALSFTFTASNPWNNDLTFKMYPSSWGADCTVKYSANNSTVEVTDSKSAISDQSFTKNSDGSYTVNIEFGNGIGSGGAINFIHYDGNNTINISDVSVTYASTYSLRSTTSTTAKLSRAASVDGGTLEFVNNVATITLSASDSWEKIISNLPVCDADGNAYYYWIEEEPVAGFTPSYKFEDGDSVTADQDYCINAAAPGNAIATVKNTPDDTGGASMPSTGGSGTTGYYGIGVIMILGSAAGYLMLRRRQKDESK